MGAGTTASQSVFVWSLTSFIATHSPVFFLFTAFSCFGFSISFLVWKEFGPHDYGTKVVGLLDMEKNACHDGDLFRVAADWRNG